MLGNEIDELAIEWYKQAYIYIYACKMRKKRREKSTH